MHIGWTHVEQGFAHVDCLVWLVDDQSCRCASLLVRLKAYVLANTSWRNCRVRQFMLFFGNTQHMSLSNCVTWSFHEIWHLYSIHFFNISCLYFWVVDCCHISVRNMLLVNCWQFSRTSIVPWWLSESMFQFLYFLALLELLIIIKLVLILEISLRPMDTFVVHLSLRAQF
jgi:hypothetical protein